MSALCKTRHLGAGCAKLFVSLTSKRQTEHLSLRFSPFPVYNLNLRPVRSVSLVLVRPSKIDVLGVGRLTRLAIGRVIGI
jgi:hypothetical protein